MRENNHDIRKRIETIVLDFEKKTMISDLKIILKIKKTELKKMLKEFSAGWAVKQHDEVFNENDKRKSFKAAVVNWLDEHEAAMMEEIVYHAVNLARKFSTDFIEKPQYIFIDEFQDLNKLEQEFINLLSKNSKLMLAAGDPDQSIYSFKHAHPAGIISLADATNVKRYTLAYSGRCAKRILDAANQLLLQAMPGRKEFLKPIHSANEGICCLIRRETQDDEFDFVLTAIRDATNNGTAPNEIIVLVPRKRLGDAFVEYAENQELSAGPTFKFVAKNDFSDIEQEKILLLGVIANLKPILRTRTYVDLKDHNRNYAPEFKQLKDKYGDIQKAIQQAKPDDFEKRKKRLRKLCEELQELRRFVEHYKDNKNVDEIIEAIFPTKNTELSDIRSIFMSLQEEGDSIRDLYLKFNDYSRSIENRGEAVRVMTLLASKGLEAEHVFIIGCNDDNIPGGNYSVYLNDHEHKQEQRRLLFTGFTRAKKKLIVSWSRYIPFEQAIRNGIEILGTMFINGKSCARVGLSEFLQDMNLS